jgi:hypothetical protein
MGAIFPGSSKDQGVAWLFAGAADYRWHGRGARDTKSLVAVSGEIMAWPSSLQVGLKEWASVCRALERGTQILLLRKGGIHDVAGEFEVEHREFVLFSTYVHQNLKMLKGDFHGDFEAATEEPRQVHITAAGVVTDIIQIQSRRQMDAIEDEHIWSPPLIDMRFNYRPENPLYLLLVRAYRLHDPQTIENTPAYAGCKSWVPFEQNIATGGATPVLDDVRYANKRDRIMDRIGAAR